MTSRTRESVRRLHSAWARARVAARRVQTPAGGPPQLPPSSSAVERLAVNCIVFSKDRAMQLDACLRSIRHFAPYVDGAVAVIYRSTAPEFDDAYRLLGLSHAVRLVEQRPDFRRDVLSLIEPDIEYTVFHTDDDVFFRRASGTPVLTPEFAAFSLRLGANTIYCYPHAREQEPPPAASDGRLMAWNWTRANDDFAYPMSLNGHIFHTRLLLRMLSRARFDNPNELEDELHIRRYLAPPAMLSFTESCVVSIPANIVTSTHRNRAESDVRSSPQALNQRFLAGECIDIEQMDFTRVRGPHQEILLAFTRSKS